MNKKFFTCTSVLALCIGPDVLLAQSEQLVCEPGEPGILNGTFDCPSLPEGTHGWKYFGPQFEGGPSFVAEVIVPDAADPRTSNYLRLSHSDTDASENYPALAMWQRDIVLGDHPAEQLVLRFDHLVTQATPYEESLIVVFKVDGPDGQDTETQELELSSNVLGSGGARWSTAELYVDMPNDTGMTSGLVCEVEIRMKQLVIASQSCDGRQTISPIVNLDNFEIRAIVDPGEVVELTDGQPLDWCLTACGGLDPNNTDEVEGTPLVRLSGSVEQDVRISQHLCTSDVVCCGPFSFKARTSVAVAYAPYCFAVSAPLGESPCPGDLDGNGVVGGPDLTILLASWGQTSGDLPTDLNCDGVINGQDLAIVIGNWGPCS